MSAQGDAMNEDEHIEGLMTEGRVGRFHRDVHSDTYDPEALERAYDEHAEHYDDLLRELAGDGTSGCSHYTTRFFAKHVPVREKMRILDAGVGTGIGGVELAELGYRPLSIVGVDLSGKMLEQARKRGIYEALHRACFPETSHLLGDDEFDAVLCAGGFSHATMPESALPDFVRVTRPGGMIVFSVRESVYARPGSAIRAMIDRLAEEALFEVVAEERGAYLPADGVRAVYLACRVLAR